MGYHIRQSRTRLLILVIVASLAAAGLWLLPITASASPPHQAGTPTRPPTGVEATVAVERAFVFAAPTRTADTLTFVYERERVPVYGQSADGVFLLVGVDTLEGWVLRAQVDVVGNLAAVPVIEPSSPAPAPTRTITPFVASATPDTRPTRTPLPSRTPPPSFTPVPSADTGADTATPSPPSSADTTPIPTSDSPLAPGVFPGTPPPISITLPDEWKALHLIVPYRSFASNAGTVPLTIYFGPLPGSVQGYVYLFWGFPNIVDMDGNYNFWADGLQLLRGTFVDDSCNLGIDQNPKAFYVGGEEGVGTFYQAVTCGEGVTDTAGWFVVVRVDEGNYAFFTAVEPLDTLPQMQYDLQAILDSVDFTPPVDESAGGDAEDAG